MKSAWMFGAASAILLSLGCETGKPELTEDFGGLAGVDEKSDQFSKKMNLVGSLDYGATATVKYHNPPKYTAYKFGGHKGDQVVIDVTSKNGDAVTWLVDNAFKIVSKNDDYGDSFNSHIEATLPGNKNADIITYYIIFQEYLGDDATFKVKLQGKAPDLFGCKTTSDCVAEPEGGCCPHGYKVAVNKNQVASWQDTQACTTVPHPICALYLVNDTRVAQCNSSTNQCEMVQPPTTCGGIAGIKCPAGQKCVDNPNDSCDPTHGGADCGGICVACIQNVLCTVTGHFDHDSCGCVPNQFCGGIAGIACPANFNCVDNPTDSCDPAHGGADCGGMCVPN